MKKILLAAVLLSLIASCAPSTEKIQQSIEQSQNAIPTLSSTNTPTSTNTSTATLTSTSTKTHTPTITYTPTVTLTPTITLPASGGISCIPKDNDRVEARVVQITDGDTIVVEIDGEEFKLRYIGIDAPEDYLGSESTEYNRKLVEGKTVTLVKDVSETDSFDRLLRYVIVDDIFINYEMVNKGYAKSGSWPPDTSCDNVFVQAQTNAQTSKRGMWQPTATYVPVPVNPTTSDSSGIVDIGTSEPTAPPSGGVCDCSIDYDCGDFSSHAEAQACYVSCGSNNWSGLDSNKDGQACESLP